MGLYRGIKMVTEIQWRNTQKSGYSKDLGSGKMTLI
jgi:hypothetical protein